MRKAYLAISYANRSLFDKEVNVITRVFAAYNIAVFTFVDHYNFKASEEVIMMQTAFNEIDSSDFLIAELTTKSIGVGIEIGYAYARKKPIIYIRKKGAEHSTTASGSSSYSIVYDNELDLEMSIKKLVSQLTSS